ncbi:MAG TPA: PD-(D/E)XK nuclease family protein [Candidatus Peribacterales bacterium]|nr:PD-(D/E)XK nuclease family protein [Candidatus Peribacterales bacterium]
MPFSYSQLSAFRSCPRKFEYEFIKKLKAPLTPEGCFGVSMHSCLSKWGKIEQAVSEERLAINSQTTLFEESGVQSAHCVLLSAHRLHELWRESFVIAGYDSTVAVDFDRARGERLLVKFFEWWKREGRKVVAVEKGFKMAIDHDDNNVITGRFDRIEELPDSTLRIIDFKTGSMRSQSEVDQDLQLSVYAIAAEQAFGKKVSELTMLFLVEEGLVEVTTTRGEGELHTAAKSISLLTERISSKDYAPTPSREKCRICPFRRICDASAAR